MVMPAAKMKERMARAAMSSPASVGVGSLSMRRVCRDYPPGAGYTILTSLFSNLSLFFFGLGKGVFRHGGGGNEGGFDGADGGCVAHFGGGGGVELCVVGLLHGLSKLCGHIPLLGGAFNDGFESHLVVVCHPRACFLELDVGLPSVGAVAYSVDFFYAHALAV